MFWSKKKTPKTENKPPKTKNKLPKIEDIQAVNHYYLSYNGKQGYVQVVGRIEKKFIAVIVNNAGFPSGKVNRIMKVIKRDFFSDFGGTCTQLDIEGTEFHLNS